MNFGSLLTRSVVAGLSIAIAAVVAFPAGASAIQRVQDGNFESSVCHVGLANCTSPAWTPASEGGYGSGVVIDPLCGDPVFAGASSNCAIGGLSGYTSPYHWARLGSEAFEVAGGDRKPDLSTSISQDVLIPASLLPSQPATLSFELHIINMPYATGSLIVSVGGVPVFSATDATPGYANYALVTVPLDAFAGPGPKTLKFEGTASTDPGSAPDGSFVDSSTFDVDDVSLDAPALRAAPHSPTAAGTGQRAAALAKCRMKHGKKRRKCKRKASRLPV
jgi:hypothetical protein